MDPTSSARHRPPGGGREDCWSEGATEILIQAWGDRYVSLNRGNLRQKDWKEVADAVNGRQNGIKPRKTDIQCKNRIDTLKKKYKVEKAKTPPSKWPFYYPLDMLIGTNAVTPKKTLTLTVKSKANSKPGIDTNSTDSSSGEEKEEDENDASFDERVVKKEHRMEDVDFSDGAACREMARAILKFGEIYERIESAKQQQMMELEKQRMEFTKELEFERMNMFMEAQLELQRKSLKRAKCASGSGKKQ